MDIQLLTSEMLELFGCSKSTLQAWRLRGLPQISRGRWPLKQAFDWYISEIIGGKEVGERLSRAKADFWQAKAIKENLDADRRTGELIPTDQARRVWSQIIMTFKARLEAIPRKMTPVVYGMTLPEIHEALSGEVNMALSELANPDLRTIARKAGIDEQGPGPKAKMAKAKTRRKVK